MNLFDQWKNNKIKIIRNQLNKLGTSLDYTREYFTLDPKIETAVITAFVQLFDQGHIYRQRSLVNWSYFLKTTISDFEINHLNIKGKTLLTVPGMNNKVEFGLSHRFGFPIVNGKPGEQLVVATNCIETLPGDVAVAVHPSDVRYSHLINQQLLNPLTGSIIPVVADEIAKPDYGTGAVKITPSSDSNDYQVAIKHNLKVENFFHENGTLIEDNLLPEYSILAKLKHCYEAKDEIIKILTQLKLYHGCQEVSTKVPICSRSGDIIFKRILNQWFVNMKPATQEIMHLIEKGILSIQPQNHKSTLFEWLKNTESWCISRQIPLGHRIPAFCFKNNGEEIWIAAKSEDEARIKAASKLKVSAQSVTLEQDKDVLDTWFSSALLPFASLGWPNQSSDDLKNFFPLSLLETGYDILGFWVLRMIVLSLYLTKQLPFTQVRLHGMVCDSQGKKMSKSKGNVIDPLDVIDGITLKELKNKSNQYLQDGILSQEDYPQAIAGLEKNFSKGIVKCGADALRLSLFEKDAQAQVMRLGLSHIVHNRNLINKMWQTYRFFNLQLKTISSDHQWSFDVKSILQHYDNLTQVDKWMLSCVSQFIINYPHNLESFSFDKIYKSFHRLWVQQLCDIFIELIKPSSNEPLNSTSLNVLVLSLKTTLIALHPLLPFITEELYQRICKDVDPLFELQSIQKQKFPDLKDWNNLYKPRVDQNMKAMISLKRKLLAFINSCKLLKEEISSLRVQVLDENRSFEPIFGVLERFTLVNDVNFITNQNEAMNNAITLYLDDAIKVLIKPSKKLVDSYFTECDRKMKVLNKSIANIKDNCLEHSHYDYKQELSNQLRLVKMEKEALEKVKPHFIN